MLKKWSIPLAFLLLGLAAYPQVTPADTLITPAKDISVIDTTIDYDQLFQDFDAFMDSILSPHNYFLMSLSVAKGYYNFESKDGSSIQTSKKLTYSPLIGYYHKSGLGLTATGYIVNDEKNANLYQVSVAPSFDYIQDKRLVTGISFTKYFTRDNLPFYTTPLQNELYAYFTYRKTWIRPTLAMSYGWGSRKDYSQRELLIQDLRLRRRGFIYINSEESINDFSIMGSVRHDFYWLDVFTYNDHIRLTPQITFTSGTQKFGFNQTSNTYATVLRTGNNVLFNSDNVYLDDQINFQPLSLSVSLKSEYSIGKFFVQPQLLLDYYFPAPSGNFNTLFSINAGLIF